MKKQNKIVISIFLAWFFTQLTFYPNCAFSQTNSYYSSNIIKSLINPSLIGNNNFDWNIHGIHSTKRSIVSENRNSLLVGGDYKIYFSPDKLIVGASISRNAYAGLPLSEYEFTGTVAYQKAMANQNIYIGVQSSFVSEQIDANELLFPDQYDRETGGYNGSTPTLEPLGIENVNYFNLSAGIASSQRIFNFESLLGLSVFSINQPIISIDDKTARKPLSILFHANTKHQLSDKFSIVPEYYMHYNEYFMENKPGFILSASNNRMAIPIKSVWTAAYVSIRNNEYPDLVLTQLGIQFYKFKAIFNYDFSLGVNNSSLQNYQVFELGIIFNGFNSTPQSYTIPCQVF